MGRAANRDGEPDRAMEYFRKAKELGFPRQPDLVMAMAEASLTQAVYFPQRRAQSLALCRNYAQEAQRTFQNPLVAAGVDAQAAYAQGKPGEVLTILKPILAEQKPGDGSSGQVDGYVCAVVAAMELGQRDQAQKLIDRGIEMFASAQNKPHYYYFRPYAEALLLYRDIHFSPPITLASYDTREQLFKKLENSGVFCPASSRNTQKRMHDFLAARQHKDQQGMMDALKGLIMMYGHQDNRNACAEYLLMLRPMLRMSALVELGDLYAAQGKKAEALACYQEAGREMPRETIVKERIATLN